jgi:hypothetical protein
MGELQQYTQSIMCLPFSHNLNNKREKKTMGEKKNKEMNNLEP